MNGTLNLGKGRISACYKVGNETVVMIRNGGALKKKRLTDDRRIIDDGIISYKRDCFDFPFGLLELDTECTLSPRRKDL